MSGDALDALRTVWQEELPITGALGIAVVSAPPGALVLQMPLAPNRNHKGTAFAGSLSALTTLAGWSLLWLALREAGDHAHVVIQDSSMRYLKPVHSDAIASYDCFFASATCIVNARLKSLNRNCALRACSSSKISSSPPQVCAAIERP